MENNLHQKPYDESVGTICFRYGAALASFTGTIWLGYRSWSAVYNDSLIENLRQEVFTSWSNEAFNTFIEINQIGVPIAALASPILGYKIGKAVNKGIRFFNESLYNYLHRI